ncbi:tumor necrosis factor receptor superfamily member 5-like isoform X1, partial [Arapaima gigas]
TISKLFLFLSCANACGPAEYKIGGECCPVCTPGYRVYGHCTAYTSTTCIPCTGSTFMDKPNGLTTCKPCTVCDPGLGLKTVKECTASSDTVCGVLEGSYCVDPYEGGCRAAEKHTTCKPGQFIKHSGKKYSDTVCENCAENSYSNGSSRSCTPHTDCESKGLLMVKPGNSVSDSECRINSQIFLSLGIIVAIILLGGAAVCALILKKAASFDAHGMSRREWEVGVKRPKC